MARVSVVQSIANQILQTLPINTVTVEETEMAIAYAGLSVAAGTAAARNLTEAEARERWLASARALCDALSSERRPVQ